MIASWPTAAPDVEMESASPRRFVNQPATSLVTLTGLIAAKATDAIRL